MWAQVGSPHARSRAQRVASLVPLRGTSLRPWWRLLRRRIFVVVGNSDDGIFVVVGNSDDGIFVVAVNGDDLEPDSDAWLQRGSSTSASLDKRLSKVPNGTCPRARAVARMRQSEKPTVVDISNSCSA